jgi:hypothetical protein
MIQAPGSIFTTLHFFGAYEWAPQAGVLYYTILERLAKDKHSSLLQPFLSYPRCLFKFIIDSIINKLECL